MLVSAKGSGISLFRDSGGRGHECNTAGRNERTRDGGRTLPWMGKPHRAGPRKRSSGTSRPGSHLVCFVVGPSSAYAAERARPYSLDVSFDIPASLIKGVARIAVTGGEHLKFSKGSLE